jgi:catechol 2,3-dioxygenase-like lactoylglutathione lyase family enzyme
MSTTLTPSKPARKSHNAQLLDAKLEVVVIPVLDVDRAKRFYENLGWRLDADFASGHTWRVVQLTPPGSACSVMFGKGLTNAAPGFAQGMMLIVDDIEAAHEDLAARGADVSDVFHFEGNLLSVTGTNGHVHGPDPDGQPYRSWASFSDPDGNGWMIQEVKRRLPGRGQSLDVASLTELLREAEAHHGEYEASAPKHHWSGWYAAYIIARERGKSVDKAAQDAAVHMSDAKIHNDLLGNTIVQST